MFAIEIAAIRPDLLLFARRLASDEHEAGALVDLVVSKAAEQIGLTPIGELRAMLFGLMRSAFHSVERRRQLLPSRRGGDRSWNAARAATYALPSRIPS